MADDSHGAAIAPKREADALAGAGFRAWHLRWVDRLADIGIALPVTRHRRQERLAVSLNQVASAISSTMRTHEVLRTMVDEAKALVETDKSVLCLLADGGPGPRIDGRAIFVRGRRSWVSRIGPRPSSARCVSGSSRLRRAPRRSESRMERRCAILSDT